MIKKGIYRHFKGNLYRVIMIARNSETNEDMVVYQSLKNEEEYWVRPLHMWEEKVQKDNQMIPRFVFIGDK